MKPASEKNVLAVRLQADQPGCRWYSGAGLYRHVHLIVTQPVHVAQWGTYITTPAVTPGSAQVKVNTVLRNDSAAAANATLTTILLDPSGKEVARLQSGQAIPAKGSAPVEQTLPVASPQRWSCETPLLYQAVSEVRVGTVLVDSLRTPFGIRTIEFTKDKGFFLNGERVQIKGVCDHHDLGCLGAAAYRRAIQRQIEVLKSFGCNAIRTSHNPPAPELLDLCDQMGMLVMDEAFDEWKENHQQVRLRHGLRRLERTGPGEHAGPRPQPSEHHPLQHRQRDRRRPRGQTRGRSHLRPPRGHLPPRGPHAARHLGLSRPRGRLE